MTDLDRYLAQYFLNVEQFAAHCGLELDELRDLIRRKLVPAPSYVVRDGMLLSYVFGAMPAPGAVEGEYFHPAMSVWVAKARHDLAARGAEGAQERARRGFTDDFATALRELNTTLYRLTDAFDATGRPLATGLSARLESAWEHFLHGTFGLCVANPESARDIARKEVLQEQLTALTDNGAKRTFAGDEAAAVQRLIDQYVRASMPFSPIEYSRSSRKRLVDDVLEGDL
jgi:Family of unknown function (DUF6058)